MKENAKFKQMSHSAKDGIARAPSRTEMTQSTTGFFRAPSDVSFSLLRSIPVICSTVNTLLSSKYRTCSHHTVRTAQKACTARDRVSGSWLTAETGWEEGENQKQRSSPEFQCSHWPVYASCKAVWAFLLGQMGHRMSCRGTF